MKLKLMTAERTLFLGEVTSVAGKAPRGEFELLENHAAWVSPVSPCCLKVTRPEGRLGESAGGGEAVASFAVHGGIIEVKDDSVLVLADAAEPGDDIDYERAERALDLASKRIASGRTVDNQPVDIHRARSAMARAEARLECRLVRM